MTAKGLKQKCDPVPSGDNGSAPAESHVPSSFFSNDWQEQSNSGGED